MKIAVVTSSSSYEPRAEKIAEVLKELGHQVVVIESDFIHREKTKGRPPLEGHIYIDTFPYNKNISLRRLYSQYNFSKKAYKQLELLDVEGVYILIPANSLAKYTVKYKEKYNTKIAMDIIDLWPESFPVRKVKKLWPFRYWANLRNHNLRNADMVITECELYKNILRPYLNEMKTVTLYWPKDLKSSKTEFHTDKNYLHICYLGSINNIIDIDFIVRLLKEIDQTIKIWFHIIGDGENREKFLKKLSEEELNFTYHGTVYSEDIKREIFSLCSFGLNIMKDTVCVGVTMKSVDYLSAGLPMINNIKGDTWSLIEQYDIGYNCDTHSIENVAEAIAKASGADEYKRERAYQVYQEMFSLEAFETVLRKYMSLLFGV